MKRYTQKQIKELKDNIYTFRVDEKRIFFTIEFKKVFWTKYQAGMSPRAILKDLNYNSDYFTQGQVDNIVQRVKKEALSGEFTEGYSRNNRMKIAKPPDDISPQNSDGIHKEFSTQEVIQKYRLGSSANVATVKRALIKKELIETEKREVTISDPLLKVWLQRELL